MQSWFGFSKHDKMFSVTYGIAVVLDVLQRMKVGESMSLFYFHTE
jgi:hypothetical protein